MAKAAGKRFNLVMLGATSTGAAMTGSWLLAGISVFVYALAVALDLRRAELWRTVLQELRCRPPALPEPTTVAEGEARLAAYRLQEARDSLERPAPSGRVWPVRAREYVVALERQAIELIASLEGLDHYLRAHPLGPAQRDAREAEARAQECSEAPTQADCQWRLSAARRRVAEIDRAGADRARVRARLEATIATLEAVACRMVRPELEPAAFEDAARCELLESLDETSRSDAAPAHDGAAMESWNVGSLKPMGGGT